MSNLYNSCRLVYLLALTYLPPSLTSIRIAAMQLFTSHIINCYVTFWPTAVGVFHRRRRPPPSLLCDNDRIVWFSRVANIIKRALKKPDRQARHIAAMDEVSRQPVSHQAADRQTDRQPESRRRVNFNLLRGLDRSVYGDTKIPLYPKGAQVYNNSDRVTRFRHLCKTLLVVLQMLQVAGLLLRVHRLTCVVEVISLRRVIPSIGQ